MSTKLNGRVAVVTGASKGIGAQIARQLAADGAAVVVNYASSRKDADRVVGDIVSAGGRAVAVQANLANEADVVRLFAEAKKSFGRLDILVNNAGVYEFKALDEITAEHFLKITNLNVLGLLLASREAARLFGDEGGNIINISSAISTYAPPGSAVYTASKASVDVITKVLAKELGGRRIRVNAVNPGMVETEGTTSSGITADESEFKKTIVAQTPLGRIGQPIDIAPAVSFLVSNESSWITGETLFISGGFR